MGPVGDFLGLRMDTNHMSNLYHVCTLNEMELKILALNLWTYHTKDKDDFQQANVTLQEGK